MDLGLIKTVFLFYGVLSIGYAFSLILYLGSSRKSVVTLWTTSAFLLGIATLLTVNRQENNLLLTYVVANGIAFVGSVLGMLSLYANLGKSFNTRLLIIYNLLIGIAYCITLNVIGTYFEPAYQSIFVSTMLIAVHVFSFFYAFKIYQLTKNRHALALSIAFLLGALVWLTRVFLIFGGLALSAFDDNFFNTIIFILIFIFGIMRYFFFYGILYSRENQDLLTASQLLVEKNELLKALSQEQIKSERANEAKGQFLANISHEIRTPLHGLIGLVSMILKSSMSEEIRKSLDKVLYSSKSLLLILNDILDFSKIEAGVVEVNKEPFKIKHLVDDVYDLFSLSASEKHIDLRFDIDPTIPEVIIGDFYKLRQVLFNLVGNSIKFTQQGYVEVKVLVNQIEEESVRLIVTVKDTGIGVSEKDVDFIFEPFNQLDNTNSRQYEGVGLGLPISRNILMKMGSELKIKSQLGVGTEFTFEIYLEINDAVPYKHRAFDLSSSGEDGRLRYAALVGRRLLVAEDNPINIEVVRQYLNFLKIESHFVTDGLQCIEALKNNTYDGVLMDIQMPNLDGSEATYLIRSIPELKDLPIIGLSAGVAKRDRENGLKSGMNDFLAKPFDAEDLAEILMKYFG